MRRAGQNPTDVEVRGFCIETVCKIREELSLRRFLQVHDMINKIDDGSGVLNFEDFQMVKQIPDGETN